MKKSVLFLNGGPGLNTELERRTLESSIKELGVNAVYWHEPSQNRPEGDKFSPEKPLDNWIASAEKALSHIEGSVILVASSVGFLGATALVQRDKVNKIERVISVAGMIDINSGLIGMMKLALKDFEEASDKRAEAVRASLESTRSMLDEPMQAGLGVAGQDEKLFGHYFKNSDTLGNFVKVISEPRFAWDQAAQGSILADIAFRFKLENKRTDVPVTLVFGQHDPVVDRAEETALARKYYGEVETLVFEESAHFPHIEEAGRFTKLLGTYC